MCNRNKKGKEITEYILLGLGLNVNCPVTNETVCKNLSNVKMILNLYYFRLIVQETEKFMISIR